MEERLKFLATGDKPRKNKEVMDEVIADLKKEGLYYSAEQSGATKTKKRTHDEIKDVEDKDERPKKKKKKSKE
jgi:hypothetical protein